MICKKCGTIHQEETKFCVNCGASMDTRPANVVTAQQPETQKVPEQYRPLGAWAYFGYQLLFALPIVGFIMLIIFSCDSSNLNRRNFSRSYWCSLLVGFIILIAVVVFAAVFGYGLDALYRLS